MGENLYPLPYRHIHYVEAKRGGGIKWKDKWMEDMAVIITTAMADTIRATAITMVTAVIILAMVTIMVTAVIILAMVTIMVMADTILVTAIIMATVDTIQATVIIMAKGPTNVGDSLIANEKLMLRMKRRCTIVEEDRQKRPISIGLF